MNQNDLIHNFFTQCMEFNLNNTNELLQKAKSNAEKDFIILITDFVIQQKQKQIIAENKF